MNTISLDLFWRLRRLGRVPSANREFETQELYQLAVRYEEVVKELQAAQNKLDVLDSELQQLAVSEMHIDMDDWDNRDPDPFVEGER